MPNQITFRSPLGRKLLVAFLPCLLLLLCPLHISWGIVMPRYAKYGTMDSFWLLLAVSATALLLLDLYVRHKNLFSKKVETIFFSIAILALSLTLRLAFFDYQSQDYKFALAKWYDFIKNNGGFRALKYEFSDYNASYLYLTAFLTYLPIHKLYAIKLSSIFFDYVGAYFVYKIVRLKYVLGLRPLAAALVVLFAPSVVFNSSLWAQCDMIYTSFLLLSAYLIMRPVPLDTVSATTDESRFSAWVQVSIVAAFAVALMFKLQAVFFILPLLYLYINRQIALGWFLLVVPGITALTLLPNYLLGRSLGDLLMIYARQAAGNLHVLTANAPSIYGFLPEDAAYEPFVRAGIVVLLASILVFMFLFIRKNIPFTRTNILLLCMVSVLFFPYILPKMHERYFFAADIFAIVYAFYRPKRWFVPICVGAASVFAYFPFLLNAYHVPLFPLSLLNGLVLLVLIYDFATSFSSPSEAPTKEMVDNYKSNDKVHI